MPYFNFLLKNIEKIRITTKKPCEISDTITIFGSPRSGTTWLMELISELPNYFTIFEPLHKIWFPESKERGFKTRTYISPYEKNKEYYSYLQKVFKGQIFSSTPHFKLKDIIRRFQGKKTLVKFIRANRMMPWIISNFETYKNILIIRHPCSTIASQMKTGARGYFLKQDKYPKLSTVLSEAKRIVSEDILRELQKIKTREEILSAIWSLDQYVPFLYKDEFDFTLVSYEDLVLNAEDTISMILNDIGYDSFIPKIMKNIDSPSMMVGDLKSKKNEQLNKWKEYLSDEQIKNILDVVNLFDIDFYDRNTIPDYSKINKWSEINSYKKLDKNIKFR